MIESLSTIHTTKGVGVFSWHVPEERIGAAKVRSSGLIGQSHRVLESTRLTHCGPHMARDGSLFEHRGFVKPLDGPWDKALIRRASNASLHRTSSHHHTTTPPNTSPLHSHALGRPWGVVAAKLG